VETIDMKKLETAILYLQRIADGNNPVNNMPVDEDSVLNNPNVIRCMFFVKEVLEAVKRNEGVIGRKPKKSEKAQFPIEALEKFTYSEDKAISKLVGQLNELIDTNIYQKLSYKPIIQWLKLNEFLVEKYSEEFEKNVTRPTEKGERIGIRAERRSSSRGFDYMLVLYGKNAQEFIVHNMEAILNGEVADM